MKNQALDNFRDLSGDKSRQQTAHTVSKKNYIARVLVLTHDCRQTLQSILHVRLRGVCQQIYYLLELKLETSGWNPLRSQTMDTTKEQQFTTHKTRIFSIQNCLNVCRMSTCPPLNSPCNWKCGAWSHCSDRAHIGREKLQCSRPPGSGLLLHRTADSALLTREQCIRYLIKRKLQSRNNIFKYSKFRLKAIHHNVQNVFSITVKI